MKKFLAMIPLLALLFSATSCGRFVKIVVSDFDFSTEEEDQQTYLSTSFALALGNVNLPSHNIPLPGGLGDLRLYQQNGANRVGVALNLTEVFKLPAGEATLPNGDLIPVDPLGAGVITIPVPGLEANVYVARNNNITLVGFAFAIRQLDPVGRTLGNFGIFPNFDIGGVNITAGIFSSDEAGRTGIAAFANLGNLKNLESEGPASAVAREAFKPLPRSVSPELKRKEKELARTLLNIKSKTQTLELVRK